MTYDAKSLFISLFPDLGDAWSGDKCVLRIERDEKAIYTTLHHDKDRESFPDTIRYSITHDGTLANIHYAVAEVIKRVVFVGLTEKNPLGAKVINCTFGDFTIENEDCSGTKDRPWLTTRTTVTLPLEVR